MPILDHPAIQKVANALTLLTSGPAIVSWLSGVVAVWLGHLEQIPSLLLFGLFWIASFTVLVLVYFLAIVRDRWRGTKRISRSKVSVFRHGAIYQMGLANDAPQASFIMNRNGGNLLVYIEMEFLSTQVLEWSARHRIFMQEVTRFSKNETLRFPIAQKIDDHHWVWASSSETPILQNGHYRCRLVLLLDNGEEEYFYFIVNPNTLPVGDAPLFISETSFAFRDDWTD